MESLAYGGGAGEGYKSLCKRRTSFSIPEERMSTLERMQKRKEDPQTRFHECYSHPLTSYVASFIVQKRYLAENNLFKHIFSDSVVLRMRYFSICIEKFEFFDSTLLGPNFFNVREKLVAINRQW